ncbi:unnamed protein product, partial [Rotaria sp. Silwood1]
MEGNFDYFNRWDTDLVNNDDNSAISVGLGSDCSTHSNEDLEVQSNSISIPVFRCSKSH